MKRSLIYLELNKIKIEHVVIAGGVASNAYIRKSLDNVCGQFGIKSSIPPISYCTDNGVFRIFFISYAYCVRILHRAHTEPNNSLAFFVYRFRYRTDWKLYLIVLNLNIFRSIGFYAKHAVFLSDRFRFFCGLKRKTIRIL